MHSDESGRSGASQQSASEPDPAAIDSSLERVFYCPDCGSRLRVIVADGAVDKVVRDEHADCWTRVQGQVQVQFQGQDATAPAAAPGSAEAMPESIDADSVGAFEEETPPLPSVSDDSSESLVDSASLEAARLAIAGADAAEQAPLALALQEPETPDGARDEDEVLDIDSMLESRPSESGSQEGAAESESGSQEGADDSEARTLRHPSVVLDELAAASKEAGTEAAAEARAFIHGSGDAKPSSDWRAASASPNASIGSAEASGRHRNAAPASVVVVDAERVPVVQPSQRVLASDAPFTRDAAPPRRRSSGLGYVSAGLGMAALGLSFMIYSQIRSGRSEATRPLAAVDVAEPELPTIQDAPASAVGAEVPDAPSAAEPSDPSGRAAGDPAEPQAVPTQAVPTQAVPTGPDTQASSPGAVPDAKDSRQPRVVRGQASDVRPAQPSSVTPKGTQPKATGEAEEAEATPAVARFDADAAAGALNSAAGRAASCRQPSDPSGVALVTVTFAPSGRVTNATISGPPFAGTGTGSCIASTLRSAQVPPFVGEHVTVRKKVTIQ